MSGRGDSAGRPWAGRSFQHHDTAYADDDGSAPPAFVSAATALAAGEATVDAVVEALRGSRLLVPLVAEAGDTATVEGRTIDKSQELSIVAVAGPDGAPILPMTSSAEAMRAWRPDARPVPASIERCAAAALEDAGRIVVDPGSSTEVVLRRSALVALLTGEPWLPPHEHPVVQAEIVAPLAALDGIEAVALADADPTSRLRGRELEVRAVASPGVDRGAVQAAFEHAVAGIGARRAAWQDAVTDVAIEVVWLAQPTRIASGPHVAVYRTR
ncbi:SseB family protein [Agrococcus sp. SGAir0287]|uniref:SseB family protein n=1 Tax=Agrococcus sp. SGAir0287 TaxID=2070347 RepID=UPI0010CCFF24|nr:SseB family protein [Agrococcus sp. SGAir0287]QCR19605.1 hypothetical protein C1N71_09375 [Agrococcus sp. SGAir0287]